MICKNSPKTDRLQVALAHIDEPIPCEFHDYAKPLHSELNACQIKKWKSRRMAFFLLHQLFHQLNLETESLSHIQKTRSGRPYLFHPHIDFNISDSGEYVAVIVSYAQNKKVVGIDLEHPQKKRDFEKLLAHYANEEELAELNITQESDFYLSWCLREAVLKSQGVGIVKLSEVRHFPKKQQIYSAHCPQGTLHFFARHAFYFCYFFEQSEHLFTPELFNYQQGCLQKMPDVQPLVYAVNPPLNGA